MAGTVHKLYLTFELLPLEKSSTNPERSCPGNINCRQVTGLQQNVRMVQEAATCLGFIGFHQHCQ